VTEARRDRRAERHAATRREILDAAWALARDRGLGGWSLRDVADAVGMRAPSLYGYFTGKNAVYDAMFADGYATLDARSRPLYRAAAEGRLAPVEAVRSAATLFVEFCVEDPARMHLLFLRTVPGFRPSEDAYAPARDVLGRMAEVLAAAGAGAPEQLDLWTALLTGLATQQVSNDPGGDRWRRLVEPAVDMFVAAQLPVAAQRGARPAAPPTIEG
jgi:AcrR family transcriptional regulator